MAGIRIMHLYRVDFDNMENHNARSVTRVKTFLPGSTESATKTAHGNCADWLASQGPERHYLGWDGKVYPQFYVEEEEA